MRYDPLVPRPFGRPEMVVPTADGLEWWAADGTIHEAHGREDCARMMRACSGVSRAGTWPRRPQVRPDLYTTASHSEILSRCGWDGWSGRRRHGRITSITHELGTTVTIYPACTRPPSDWFAFLRWGRDRGMTAGGLGGMGRQLWRSTLAHPVAFNGPRLPGGQVDPMGREAVAAAYFGARKEAPAPGLHRSVVYWDMASAYPTALAQAPIASSLREIKVGPRWKVPPSEHGVAYAGIAVDPPAPWSPIPIRVTPHAYRFGNCKPRMGYWTWRDLHNAQDRGDFVRVERAWAPHGETWEAFGPDWLALVGEARELPRGAAWWAKRAVNACWGMFAFDPGAVDRLAWSDEGTRVSVQPGTPMSDRNPLRDALYVGAEVTARCRQRVWDDALSLGGAVYVDTDAVVLPAGVTPRREGAGLGEWSARERMDEMEIRAPGIYRFRRSDDPGQPMRYVTAGIRAGDVDRQRWLFEHHAQNTVYGSQVFGGDQVCLPPGDVDYDDDQCELFQ